MDYNKLLALYGILELLNMPQFTLPHLQKSETMTQLLQKLHASHYDRSKEYRDITKTLFFDQCKTKKIGRYSISPVSAFKNHHLKSISEKEIFKVLTSSGTTGQEVSKIYLDKQTATLQTLALSKILTNVIGTVRLPMLIIDSKSVFSNKQSFSARGAGILGISVFGKDHTYILDENFEPVEKNSYRFSRKIQRPADIDIWFYFYGLGIPL